MITEFRRLIFSKDEILKAILSYNLRSSVKLPPGDITNIKTTSVPEPAIVLDVHDPSSDTTETVTLESTYLAATMLRYCIEFKIPIPRHADKYVEIVGDGVALSMSIDANAKKLLEIQI